MREILLEESFDSLSRKVLKLKADRDALLQVAKKAEKFIIEEFPYYRVSNRLNDLVGELRNSIADAQEE